MKSLLAETIFGLGMKCDQIHKPTKKDKKWEDFHIVKLHYHKRNQVKYIKEAIFKTLLLFQ